MVTSLSLEQQRKPTCKFCNRVKYNFTFPNAGQIWQKSSRHKFMKSGRANIFGQIGMFGCESKWGLSKVCLKVLAKAPTEI